MRAELFMQIIIMLNCKRNYTVFIFSPALVFNDMKLAAERLTTCAGHELLHVDFLYR